MKIQSLTCWSVNLQDDNFTGDKHDDASFELKTNV